MRVVAGKVGGRKLIVPKGRDIRPTSDKIRGAIFNSLESMGAVQGARVLDGFCGTGALGIEALSRGASHCAFVDKSRTSLNLAKENVGALNLEKEAVFHSVDLAGSFELPVDEPFSLVLLDPPYNQDLISTSLQWFSNLSLLRIDTICIVEGEKGHRLSLSGSFELLNQKIYGDTQVSFLRYMK